jgi:predicted HNH restriction endonuclease
MRQKRGINIDTSTPEGKKAYGAIYRKLNKERAKEQSKGKTKERRKENKIRAVNYLGGECERCGLISPYYSVYDFHRRNPEEKEADPGTLLHRSWETVFKEINKCMLLCANCHRIVHEMESINGC